MNVIVQKYGGSSVSTTENLYKVCNHITKEYNANNKVVVVVSAQGKTTDNLLEEGLEINNNPSKREMDVLISAGEQISSSKLAIYLNKLGYKAKSFTGWQVPIITDNINGNARIKRIDNKKIKEALKDNYIVIVAGFQGIDDNNNITTLGRGGSDTTAVALAASLKAQKVEIYTDIDGVYFSDPKVVPNAIKYEKISYDNMLKLANAGAKVLQSKSVEIGRRYNIPIVVKSTFIENSKGTLITKEDDDNTKDRQMIGLAKLGKLTQISIIEKEGLDKTKIIKYIKDTLKEINVKNYKISNSKGKISLIVNEEVSDMVMNAIYNRFF